MEFINGSVLTLATKVNGANPYGPYMPFFCWYHVVCLKMAHHCDNMACPGWNHLGPMFIKSCKCEWLSRSISCLATKVNGPIWALYAIFMLVPSGLFENGPTWWQHCLPRLKPSWPNALPIWLPINHIGTRLGQFDNPVIWFRHIETIFSQCNIPFKWKFTFAPCCIYVTFCLPPLAHQTT